MKLDELGRPWPESKKVEHFVACIRTKTKDLTFAINTVRNNTGPNIKYNNFEATVAYLSRSIPVAKDKVRIRSIETKVGSVSILIRGIRKVVL